MAGAPHRLRQGLADRLCALVPESCEWRLLGQEADSSLLFSWSVDDATVLGVYRPEDGSLSPLHQVARASPPAVQASVNADSSLLAYVTKEEADYRVHLVCLQTRRQQAFPTKGSGQARVQFLRRRQGQDERLLVLVHRNAISLYTVRKEPTLESVGLQTICKCFNWAQWVPSEQVLYYVHDRKISKNILDAEAADANASYPMLSGLQFHDAMPHETVLNIPLDERSSRFRSVSESVYDEVPVPLRIQDCSLDMQILTNADGTICICHSYIYQMGESESVHLAYSVTVLHHSCVLNCTVPGLDKQTANAVKPLFQLWQGNYVSVLLPGLYLHMLDISADHEPCSHWLVRDNAPGKVLVPLAGFGGAACLDMDTLDVLELQVAEEVLQEAFQEPWIDNRLAVLHCMLAHQDMSEAAGQLVAEAAAADTLGAPSLLKEYLVGGAFSATRRGLPDDAAQLVGLVPSCLASPAKDTVVGVSGRTVHTSCTALRNTDTMLLAPRQRIAPYSRDVWTHLWEKLVYVAKVKHKFRHSQVAAKLVVSLACYKPEALSRCSTPLSPGACPFEIAPAVLQAGRKSQPDELPFPEIEACTASKQEHVISVNLRELSMHLLKVTSGESGGRPQRCSQVPIHAHTVASRYVAAQIDQSKKLCSILCKLAADQRTGQEKGFQLIDRLGESRRNLLFATLEKYYLAAETIAFPLPQGFTSFFTYLGFRSLPMDNFIRYVGCNVFELHIDAMKAILSGIDNSREGIRMKLKLMSLLPRSRTKRLLNQWRNPISLMLRAREHSLYILSGVEGGNTQAFGSAGSKKTKQMAQAAFPSGDRASPLDTFLSLLSAKAGLSEVDVMLLIEATYESTRLR